MVNLYIEKNNKVVQYYDLPEAMVRMITNVLDSVTPRTMAETEDGYKVDIIEIDRDN